MVWKNIQVGSTCFSSKYFRSKLNTDPSNPFSEGDSDRCILWWHLPPQGKFQSRISQSIVSKITGCLLKMPISGPYPRLDEPFQEYRLRIYILTNQQQVLKNPQVCETFVFRSALPTCGTCFPFILSYPVPLWVWKRDFSPYLCWGGTDISSVSISEENLNGKDMLRTCVSAGTAVMTSGELEAPQGLHLGNFISEEWYSHFLLSGPAENEQFSHQNFTF